MTASDRRRAQPHPQTIVLVGPCASGKTTLARELGKSGVAVRICGQEHSSIRELWRLMEPDVLVALAIDLPTLRARRHPGWPEALFATQLGRLATAYDAADLVIDTRVATPDEAAGLVLRHLRAAPAGGRRGRATGAS